MSLPNINPSPADLSLGDDAMISLPEMLDYSVQRFADRPCLDFLGRHTSYAELGRLVQRAAYGLQRHGLQRGDHVGLFLPNCPYAVIMLFAILKAGGVVVNFNPLYAPAEIRAQIIDSETRIMVTLDLVATYPKLAPMLRSTCLERIIICRMADILPFPKNLLFPWLKAQDIARVPVDFQHIPFSALIARPGLPKPVDIAPRHDVAILQYTGGTTGSPKGAMLSHDNLVTNARQCLSWIPASSREHPHKVLAVLPFFHVFALTVALMLPLLAGFEIILLPRFDIRQLFATIQRKRPTLLPGVPTLYAAINNHPDCKSYDLSSIRYCLSGGAPLPAQVKRDFEALTGCTLCEGYGLSETSPVVTANPLTGGDRPGSIGLPLPGTSVEIIALDDPTRILPPDMLGEVCVRGPQVMLGYWHRPAETAEILADGRLRTGDIGYVDAEGYVFLVDRIKDLIISAGYKIYPRHVEDAIYAHPAIAECVVIGIPDAYRGQIVKAFIACRPGQSIDEAGLLDFLQNRLSPMERPRHIEFRDSLPKTLIGKLSKKALQDEERKKQSSAA